MEPGTNPVIDKTQDPVDLEAAGHWLSHDNQDALTVEFGKRLIAEIRALRRPFPASPAPQGAEDDPIPPEDTDLQFRLVRALLIDAWERTWSQHPGTALIRAALKTMLPEGFALADARALSAVRDADLAAQSPAAPLAPDPLPAGAVEFEERLHATILEMVNEWFKVYIPYAKGAGIRPLTNKLAAKIERHFASKSPTPPESGAPAPNLREAAENLAWAAEVEIQGGHRTRAFIQQHRAKVAFWIKSVRAALSESEPGEASKAGGMEMFLCGFNWGKTTIGLPAEKAWLEYLRESRAEPGEKDQDGSGKPVAGASRQEEGEKPCA